MNKYVGYNYCGVIRHRRQSLKNEKIRYPDSIDNRAGPTDLRSNPLL